MRLALYAVGGGAMILAFLLESVPPASWVVVAFFLIATIGGVTLGGSPLALLRRLFLVLYALPFSVCMGYLLDPVYVWLVNPAGMTASYQQDPRLIGEMIAVGAIGLLGLLFGFEWSRALWRRPRREPLSAERRPPLPLNVAAGLAMCALGLSWLGAQPTTIFQAQYALEGTDPIAIKIRFAGATLLSYSVVILLAIDAERERPQTLRRRLKLGIVIGATFYIVAFLQLQRGSRTSIGLLTGLAFIYLTSGAARCNREIARKRLRRIVLPALGVGLLYVTIGAARYIVEMTEEDRRPLELVKKGFEQNTWTAVLLTNLGAAAEYRSGTLTYLQGETYLDYLRSLPPGFVAALIGVERPVDVSRGPAWWYAGISTGGMHPVVVPFKNFGAVGVFLTMALYGRFIGSVDLGVVGGGYWRRLLFAMTATTAFLWFWYGDMNAIRSLMMVPIVGLLDYFGSCFRKVSASRRHVAWSGQARGVSVRGKHCDETSMKRTGAEGCCARG